MGNSSFAAALIRSCLAGNLNGRIEFGGGRGWIGRTFSIAWNDTHEVLFLELYE